ncbi:MAG TPA: riboflavin synthase [Flavobacteriales bacterium]|jgi:riboflavin synthase|nr:riboflavin synthase [Flavobacteriales bacterium]
MFTGIIEKMGRVERLEKDQENLHITMASDLAPELKIDQSLSHNGVCLTVVEKTNDSYTVTAIQETLDRSNLGDLVIGEYVNLERSMQMQGRIDGHIVQGHVDQTATCVSIDEADGSWIFGFEYEGKPEDITVEKGSISVNGVSLTVVDSKPGYFSVAIIPYTYENTNFGKFEIGSKVNLEFDVIGKYVAAYMKQLKD